MSQPCKHELPERESECSGEPIAYTIQIGDDPPTFQVNTERLEQLAWVTIYLTHHARPAKIRV